MDNTGLTRPAPEPSRSNAEHEPFGQPDRPDASDPAGSDFMAMMVHAMEADEQATVERELYPGGVTTHAQRDQVAEAVEHRFGEGRSMRWGIVLVLTILALLAGAGAWLGIRGGGDDGSAAQPPLLATPTPQIEAQDATAGEAVSSDASSDVSADVSSEAILPGEPTADASAGAGELPGEGSKTTVFVAPPELVGAWIYTDGDFGYEFRADGTYTFTSLDARSEGRYSVSTATGGGSINLLDPSDPSGLTALMIIPYRFEAGSLWLTMLGDDKQMVPGEMPDPGSTAPPIVDLPAATASTLVGRVEAGQPAQLPGLSTYVSQTLDMPTATGSITIDAVAGEVDGRFEVDYACSPNYCDQPNETGSAQVVIDVLDTRPSTYMQTTWALEGTAHVRILFEATTPQANELVPWTWVGEYDATYYVGLEREWAVFDLNLRIPDDEVITLQIIGPVS